MTTPWAMSFSASGCIPWALDSLPLHQPIPAKEMPQTFGLKVLYYLRDNICFKLHVDKQMITSTLGDLSKVLEEAFKHEAVLAPAVPQAV